MLPTFIPDGYELDGFIEEVPGIHGAVNFTYRPIRIYDKTRMTQKMIDAKDDLAQSEHIGAEEVVKQLVSWDIKTPDGEDVPINKENILRLHNLIVNKIFDIIMGARASSIKKDNEKN